MGIYDGKTVVITGGSTGVGFATAKALVDEGASVLITGRTQSALDSAGEQLDDAAITVRSDAASLADIDRWLTALSTSSVDSTLFSSMQASPALFPSRKSPSRIMTNCST